MATKMLEERERGREKSCAVCVLPATVLSYSPLSLCVSDLSSLFSVPSHSLWCAALSFLLSLSSLVSGDVEGNFSSLFTRVEKVHTSKAGPFDALLCVGHFFGGGQGGDKELLEYVRGEKKSKLRERGGGGRGAACLFMLLYLTVFISVSLFSLPSSSSHLFHFG